MNKLFMLTFVIIISTFSILFLYADSNGVWHYASDVRPGIFGDDEGFPDAYIYKNEVNFESEVNFTDEVLFKDKINMTDDVFYKNIELDNRFVNENQTDSITSEMIVNGTIQGDDLTAEYKNGSVYDDRFVNENQANSITSDMIVPGTIQGEDLTHDYEIGIAYDYRFVEIAGDIMTGNLDMGDNKITNIAYPDSDTDVSSKEYVDDEIDTTSADLITIINTLNTQLTNQINTKVSKTGDTMSGNLNMGGKKITNIGTPTSNNDVPNKKYVDDKISTLNTKVTTLENDVNALENTYGSCSCPAGYAKPAGDCWDTQNIDCDRINRDYNEGTYKRVCSPSGWLEFSNCYQEYYTCLVKGTLISMADNTYKKIEEVQVGDFVKGPKSAVNKVLALEKPIIGDRGTFIINNKLEITGDHPIFTDEGWKVASLKQYNIAINLDSEAYKKVITDISPELDIDIFTKEMVKNFQIKPQELKVGDYIVTENGKEKVETIIHSFDRPQEELVYEILLDGNNAYYADGYLVHNKNS